MSRQPRAAGSSAGGGMSRIDLKVLKRMLQFMEDAGLAELDIEMEGLKVRLRKPGAGAPSPVAVAPVTPAASGGVPLAAVPAAAVPPPPPPASAAPPATPAVVPAGPEHTIRSPMVGTFYRAPSPTAPPFVNVGDTVKEGQTLCLIEAMKLMNEIKAERPGRILRILVENGQPVEFDQPLFEFEPAE
jgi:acetyl-CoA carboxylase biotin carboxyl carrier protein